MKIAKQAFEDTELTSRCERGAPRGSQARSWDCTRKREASLRAVAREVAADDKLAPVAAAPPAATWRRPKR
jgi:hypothetical protein